MALKRNLDDKFLSADACVPVSKLGYIIKESQEKLADSKMLGSFLGHVGDGNFHATVLYGAEEKEKARKLIPEIQEMSIDLDGTVSGEHVIRLEFRDKVIYELGESSVDAMRCLKLALDPLSVLNPGKMFRMGHDLGVGDEQASEYASSPGGFHNKK